jgi:hypothetical protein
LKRQWIVLRSRVGLWANGNMLGETLSLSISNRSARI